MSCDDLDDNQILSVEQALKAMLAAASSVSGSEHVPLDQAVGRVLAETLVAPRSVPEHAKVAVDGYALHCGEPTPKSAMQCGVIGTAYAGQPYRGEALRAGEAIRVMTGAVLPEGADTVVMQELATVIDGGSIWVQPPFSPGNNVRPPGEDLRQGTPMLEAGRWLLPADIGLIASVGWSEVPVRRRLRVGVLSTGDEVRGLGAPLTPGLVYDSNRYQLCAALRRMAVEVCDLGIVSDEPGRLRGALQSGANHLDVIVSSGGVSSGAADWVRDVVADIGRLSLWKVAMKPGRPLAFGTIGNALFFGLPGNPVAALVAFCWFVKPVLERRMGMLDRPLIPLVDARLEAALQKKVGRMEFQRGVLSPDPHGGYQVRTTGQQGSGILRSMSLANGLIVLPAEQGPVEAGARVSVLPFAAAF